MDFFKKLFGGSAPASPSSNFYIFNVKCNRCGEIIEGRVNLANDLSLDDEDNYFVRKVLMGSGHCFQQVEIELKFNASKQVIDKQIRNGIFVE